MPHLPISICRDLGGVLNPSLSKFPLETILILLNHTFYSVHHFLYLIGAAASKLRWISWTSTNMHAFRKIDCIFGTYSKSRCQKSRTSLYWRHNDHDGVSNHQSHGCLLNRLFRRRSKKTSKLRVTGLWVGNSPGPVNSPHKGPVTRKIFPFDDVIMMHLKM